MFSKKHGRRPRRKGFVLVRKKRSLSKRSPEKDAQMGFKKSGRRKLMRFRGVWVGICVCCVVAMMVPKEAVCNSLEGFLGKWGYVVLGKGGKGSWFGYKTEAGTVQVKGDGTIKNSYKESADRCPGPGFCQPNSSELLTYTVGQGGVLLIEEAIGCILGDSQNVMLCDGTTGREEKGERFFVVAVKLDEISPYESQDLSGDYFMGNYEKDLTGGTRGYNRLASAIVGLDGLGMVTSVEGYENGDGNVHPLNLGNIPLQLNPDGSFLVGDFATGYLDFSRQVGVVSNPSQFYPQRGDDFAAHVLLKRNDRDYSTADLEGRWAFVGFGDKAGTFKAEIGVVDCNRKGECVFSIKKANVNGAAQFLSTIRNLSVSWDGSINGFYLTSQKPHFSGALGNDGNTMIFLMNESTDTTNDRLLGLAVRYSSGNLPGFPDLVLNEISAPSQAVVGQKIRVDYTVQNQGEDSTRKKTKTSFKLVSRESLDEISLGTQCIPALKPGQEFTASKTFKLKSPIIQPGRYDLVISVDATNIVVESREDNNQGSTPLQILPAK